MSDFLPIPAGTKLHIAFDVPLGSTPDFNMICTFAKALDESAFLISIPMVGGKPLVLDENQKFLIRYLQGTEPLLLAAFPDDIVKEGIRRYWKMRKVTETRQFFQRRDERIKVALRAEYLQPSWAPNAEGVISPENAITLDISAGGVALFMNQRFDVGEILEISLPRVGIDPEGAPIESIIGVTCWNREAPKGSVFRFVSGFQFRTDELEKERITNYVGYIKKKYKL